MDPFILSISQASIAAEKTQWYNYLNILSIEDAPLNCRKSTNPVLPCWYVKTLILGDNSNVKEDLKGLMDFFVRLYIKIVGTTWLLTTILMYLSNNHIALIFLYLILSCAIMENLNIHDSADTNNSNANTRNLTPAELLDCCLVGKFLINKPIRFKAFRERLANLWTPSQQVTISAIDENRFMFQFYHIWDMERVYQGVYQPSKTLCDLIPLC